MSVFFFLLIHSTRCDRQAEASTVNALFYHIAIHCAEYFVIKTKKIDSQRLVLLLKSINKLLTRFHNFINKLLCFLKHIYKLPFIQAGAKSSGYCQIERIQRYPFLIPHLHTHTLSCLFDLMFLYLLFYSCSFSTLLSQKQLTLNASLII